MYFELTPDLSRAIIGAEDVMDGEGIDGMDHDMPPEERAKIHAEWDGLPFAARVLVEPGEWCSCHHGRNWQHDETGKCRAKNWDFVAGVSTDCPCKQFHGVAAIL